MVFQMAIQIRPYTDADVPAMRAVWNEVVRAGNAFPQTAPLTPAQAAAFFAEQTHCAVAEWDGVVAGLYILHPNNIGRCGHIANASYAVAHGQRGRHIGRALVTDCVEKARAHGFRLLQFNAVVASNTAARRLYESLGFTRIGAVPGGFAHDDGSYEEIVLYYIDVCKGVRTGY